MYAISSGCTVEMQKAEAILLRDGYARVQCPPRAPKQYCRVDSIHPWEGNFILIWQEPAQGRLANR